MNHPVHRVVQGVLNSPNISPREEFLSSPKCHQEINWLPPVVFWLTGWLYFEQLVGHTLLSLGVCFLIDSTVIGWLAVFEFFWCLSLLPIIHLVGSVLVTGIIKMIG